MHRILKSHTRGLAEDFQAAVQAYADELNAHKAHMTSVEAKPEEYVPYPPPQAHPLIARSVDEVDGKFVPQFEIVDDDPKPDDILREKKNVLLAFIHIAERAAEEAVVPTGRRRHFAIREADIATTENQRRNDLMQKRSEQQVRDIQKLAADHAKEIGATSSPKKIQQLREKHEMTSRELMSRDVLAEVEQEVAQSRPEEDTRFLAEQADRHRRLDAIRRHGAKLQHDVEDLTAETVDSWFDASGQPRMLSPFPT